MQPDAQYPSPQASAPQPTINNQPGLDYSFLDQQPKKSRGLPFAGNSRAGRIAVVLIGLLILVIIVAVVKGLLTTKSINSSDYTLVVDRQHEMLHILTLDITNANIAQLSPANQNFVPTASLALQTAESKTITLMSEYKVKVNAKKLTATFSSAIDTELTNSLQANTFNNVFQTEMTQQLALYEQELKTAYASTHASNARPLIRSEYAEAKLLLQALNATSP